jgi:mannose-1-phosphate guanylyltransferase
MNAHDESKVAFFHNVQGINIRRTTSIESTVLLRERVRVSGSFAKAFLLAAGLGTRLRPLTDRIPKCLAPIQGMPLLSIWLSICRQLGIRDVLINTHRFAQEVRSWAEQQESTVRIHLFHEENLLGSAGTIAANRDFVRDDDFFIFYADNLVRANLEALKSFHMQHTGVLTIALFHAAKPENCGIVSLDESGRITSFEEKPSHPETDLANAGIYLARRGLFELLPRRPVMDFGKDVIPGLAGNAWGCLLDGYILDIGTPENYQRAQLEWPIITTQKSSGESAFGGPSMGVQNK